MAAEEPKQTCPECGKPLEVGQDKLEMVCLNCMFAEPLPMDVEATMQGRPRMPGF